MQIKVHATSADIKRFVCLIKFMALCNKILPFGYFGDYSGFLFKRKKNLLNFFFPNPNVFSQPHGQEGY